MSESESPRDTSEAPLSPLEGEELYAALYDHPRTTVWLNLGAWALAVGGAFLFFFFGPSWFRVDPSHHFLTGIPVSGLDLLQSLSVPGKTCPEDVLTDRTVLMILWGPWDKDSAEALRVLAPAIRSAQKNKDFSVLPVAYWDVWSGGIREETPTSEDSDEVESALPAAQRVETIDHQIPMRSLSADQVALMLTKRGRFLAQAKQVMSSQTLVFPDLWWDPTEEFRMGLVGMALSVYPDRRTRANGLGLPTFLWVQNGVVLYVWAGGVKGNLEEITSLLKQQSVGK